MKATEEFSNGTPKTQTANMSFAVNLSGKRTVAGQISEKLMNISTEGAIF